MPNIILAYQPLLDLLLISIGFAFSQYIVLRSGVFSIATAGLVAIGAYCAAIMMTKFGVGIWIAAPLSAAAGLVAGLLLSIPLARLRGPYQAIATLAFVQIAVSVALYAEDYTGGAYGLNNIPKQVNTLGLLFCVALVVHILVSINRSRLGQILDALRQDEGVAGSLGISVAWYHALAFALSGGIAGLFGALQAGYFYSIAPQQYGFPLVIATLAAVILGGRRSIWGPVVGSAIIVLLPELFRPLAQVRLLMTGTILTLVIIFMPKGITYWVADLFRAQRRKSSVSQERPERRLAERETLS